MNCLTRRILAVAFLGAAQACAGGGDWAVELRSDGGTGAGGTGAGGTADGGTGAGGTADGGTGAGGTADGGAAGGGTAPPPSNGVLVTPSTAHVGPGRQVLFSASVTGSSDMSVVWSVQEGASGGTVDSIGVYTAPMTTGTYHVVARSQALSASGSATAVVAAVGSCSSLPAAGTWDATSISPVVRTAKVSYDWTGDTCAVVVDPFDSSTVWLGTGYKGLFKSTDCGATWTHVNNGTNGSAIDKSVLWSMIVDPVNQGVLYVVGAYGAGGVWKSTDTGNSWLQLFPGTSAFAQLVPNNFIGNVAMDPTNPLHLVVASHGVCNAPYKLGCMAESFDGGMTWPNIVQIPGTGWGEDGGVEVINATTWLYGTGEAYSGLYVTTNNGKSWTQALPKGGGDVNEEFTILPLKKAIDGAYYAPSFQGVVRSTDGTNWSLAWGEKNFQGAGVVAIAESTTTIYASQNQVYYSAPISTPSNWSSLKGPNLGDPNAFAGFLAYDESHKVLYSSVWTGLFRYVPTN
jgi:hypothetical protein